MTHPPSIRIMRANVYSRHIHRYKSPPSCRVCNIELDIGDKYVPKVVRSGSSNQTHASYCVKHAKEKNLI